MTRVAIVGAGALGQQIAQHLRQCPAPPELAGFFDDTLSPGEMTQGGPVLGPLAGIRNRYVSGDFEEIFLAVGYRHLAARKLIFEELSPSIPFGTFVHPAAHVDASVTLGAGCFVSPGCVLDLNVRIGPNVFLYPGCIVAHDTVIGAHSFLAPAVRLAGNVRVGECCFLGIGTTLIDGLQIADEVRTGGGAVVTTDLHVPGTYAGCPARKIS